MVLLHFCEQRFSDVLGAVDAAGVRTHTRCWFSTMINPPLYGCVQSVDTQVCTRWTTRNNQLCIDLIRLNAWTVESRNLEKRNFSPFSPSYSTWWEFFMNTWTILKVCFSILLTCFCYICFKKIKKSTTTCFAVNWDPFLMKNVAAEL